MSFDGTRAEWIRGQWHYRLTTEVDHVAVIQVEHTGRLDPEAPLYPDDYLPWTVLRREFSADENMDLELLKITGLSKATLKKRGFSEYRIFYGEQEWTMIK